MKTKRILSLLLSVLFTISLLPGGTLPVRAEEKIDVTFLIREWNNDTQSITATEMFLSGCTVVESSMTTWDYHTYVVTEDVTISTPITIACYVKLILCDGATLTADGGIIFTENGSLNIYGQSRDSGSLIAAGGDDGGAGISGDVTVYGGTVTAAGGDDGGAGISGAVTVYGGSVTAAGGDGGGAGIGGAVTVYGGTVTAAGGDGGGAGIGGGSFGDGDTVTVYGGTVTATAGSADAAAIGGGKENTDHGSLTVADGMRVYAPKDASVPVSAADNSRVNACRGESARIEPCAEHADLYTDNGDGTHTAACKWCASEGQTDYHVYENGACGLCGAEEPLFTVSVDKTDGFTVTLGTGSGITASTENGTGEITYSWSSETPELNGSGPILVIPDTLLEGEYTVQVTATDSSEEPRTADTQISFRVVDPTSAVVSYYDPANEDSIQSCETWTAVSADLTAWEDGVWYVAEGNVTVSSRIEIGGAVNLILKDGCALNAPEGIHLTGTNSLTVWSETENGNGALNAGGGSMSNGDAGIGGGMNQSGGILTINGGRVTAMAGSADAAAIGGGKGSTDHGTLTIADGLRVHAPKDASDPVPAEDSGREDACRGESARIMLCTDHFDLYADNGDGTHTASCLWCLTEKTPQAHDYESGACSLCGAEEPEQETGFTVSFDKKDGFTVTLGTESDITASAKNGREPYVYFWGSGTPELGGSGPVLPIPDSLEEGDYTVWVTATDVSDPPQSVTKEIGFSIAAREPVSYYDPVKEDPVQSCETWTAVAADQTTWEDGVWYVAEGNVTVNSRIEVNGTVNLILCDGCTLTAQKGINVTGSAVLTIYGQDTLRTDPVTGETSRGTGKLFAGTTNGTDHTCADRCAGIGGGVNPSGGTITISGGVVKAAGGSGAAGIGGGTVTINGGTVTATGGTGGAGIGSRVGTVTLTYSGSDPRVIVTASSCAGTVTLEKPFTDANGGLYPTGEASDNTALAGRTLTPLRAPRFASCSLVLSGQIGVNFFVALPALDGMDWSSSEMTFSVPHGACPESDNFDEDCKSADGRYYGFTCYINSIQMAEPVTATFHYTQDGEEKTVTVTYSCADYFDAFDSMANQYDSKTQALVRAVADYGHYVQLFLAEVHQWTLGESYAAMVKHYTEAEDFDMEAVKTASAAIAAESSNQTGGDITAVTYSLTLDSETALNVYFQPAPEYSGVAAATVDGIDAAVDVTDNGAYCVRIANIAAHKLSESHEIVLTTGEGRTVKVTVSALSYVDTALKYYDDDSDAFHVKARNAVAAIWAYAQAAYAYKTVHPNG